MGAEGLVASHRGDAAAYGHSGGASVNALRSGAQPPECTVSRPTSFPPLDELRANASAQTAR